MNLKLTNISLKCGGDQLCLETEDATGRFLEVTSEEDLGIGFSLHY